MALWEAIVGHLNRVRLPACLVLALLAAGCLALLTQLHLLLARYCSALLCSVAALCLTLPRSHARAHLQEADSGSFCTTRAERMAAQAMLLEHGYVAQDYTAECKKGEADLRREFELPDGTKFVCGASRFLAPEIMFRPELRPPPEDSDAPPPAVPSVLLADVAKVGAGGSSRGGAAGETKQQAAAAAVQPSVQQLVCDAADLGDYRLQRHLYSNVLVTGGVSKFPGFVARLESEVRARMSSRDVPRDCLRIRQAKVRFLCPCWDSFSQVLCTSGALRLLFCSPLSVCALCAPLAAGWRRG